VKNKPKEAFHDKDFLQSPEARSVRILSEYEKVKSMFEFYKIMDTITFFGSSRFKSKEDNHSSNEIDIDNSEYYEQARSLAFKFTTWAKDFSENHHRFVIATGGGPGIMEAANRGAIEGKGKSIGLGIRLPQEQTNNKYITPELSFQFHYFFMRKFFLTQPAKATIMFPGGYGWSDGQMALFPTQKTTWDKLQKTDYHKNNCGRPGVNGGYIHNPYVKYGANCYGKKPVAYTADVNRMNAQKNTVYPKSKKDLVRDMKTEYWKKNSDKLAVNGFNNDKWSEF